MAAEWTFPTLPAANIRLFGSLYSVLTVRKDDYWPTLVYFDHVGTTCRVYCCTIVRGFFFFSLQIPPYGA
jgi:hypothetical protein